MELFHKILKTAVAGGVSDVHLKIGTAVVFRIHRELLAIECPCPTEEWMSKVVAQMTPAHLKSRLEQEREIDFSYFVPGIGRFRTNLFQQRGHWCLAMRYVKTMVPKFEELGSLPQIRQIAESPRGGRHYGVRQQIHHPRRDARTHQRQLHVDQPARAQC